jgi:hypothetical protein
MSDNLRNNNQDQKIPNRGTPSAGVLNLLNMSKFKKIIKIYVSNNFNLQVERAINPQSTQIIILATTKMRIFRTNHKDLLIKD